MNSKRKYETSYKLIEDLEQYRYVERTPAQTAAALALIEQERLALIEHKRLESRGI
jgi:hypothetical protein